MTICNQGTTSRLLAQHLQHGPTDGKEGTQDDESEVVSIDSDSRRLRGENSMDRRESHATATDSCSVLLTLSPMDITDDRAFTASTAPTSMRDPW